MPHSRYTTYGWRDFGRHLLVSYDLDPVYVALRRTQRQGHLDYAHLSRWLVAYWCLYHCGAASYIAEHTTEHSFWDMMEVAARNHNDAPAPTTGRWPRGEERRHWRGQQAINSVRDIASRGKPMELINSLTWNSRRTSFQELFTACQRWKGFGPWIAFKMVDMLDRVLNHPVDYSDAHLNMFREPVKAALLIHDAEHQHPDCPDQVSKVACIVRAMTQEFSGFKAPPEHDRYVALPEVETILCKWKSHINGHYPLFNDTDKITRGLVNWEPHSRLARQLRINMPKGSAQD